MRFTNHDSRITRARGFTLIEVLAAVAILSVGAVFILEALARASQAQVLAEEHRSAYTFALSKLASLELDYEQGQLHGEHEQGRFRVGAQEFMWDLSTSAAENDPALQAVDLSVSWQRGTRDYTHDYRSIFRIPEPEDESKS